MLKTFVDKYLYIELPSIYGKFEIDKQIIINRISNDLYDDLDKYYKTIKGKTEFEMQPHLPLDYNQPEYYRTEFYKLKDIFKKYSNEISLTDILWKYIVISPGFTMTDYSRDELDDIVDNNEIKQEIVKAYLQDLASKLNILN